MSRDPRLYVEDIIDACEKIMRYTRDLSQEDFVRTDLEYDAVIRNLLVIGEAVKRLPENITEMRADIEWRKIAGLRDIVAHVYFGIDDDIVWDVVRNKIPELYNAVVAIRGQL